MSPLPAWLGGVAAYLNARHELSRRCWRARFLSFDGLAAHDERTALRLGGADGAVGVGFGYGYMFRIFQLRAVDGPRRARRSCGYGSRMDGVLSDSRR